MGRATAIVALMATVAASSSSIAASAAKRHRNGGFAALGDNRRMTQGVRKTVCTRANDQQLQLRSIPQLCFEFELKDAGDTCRRQLDVGLRLNATNDLIMNKPLDLAPPGHTCATTQEIQASAPAITSACGDQVEVR